jgi:hypothetical protein
MSVNSQLNLNSKLKSKNKKKRKQKRKEKEKEKEKEKRDKIGKPIGPKLAGPITPAVLGHALTGGTRHQPPRVFPFHAGPSCQFASAPLLCDTPTWGQAISAILPTESAESSTTSGNRVAGRYLLVVEVVSCPAPTLPSTCAPSAP